MQASNEYLTFTLGKEEYGIRDPEVQEIRGYETVDAESPTRPGSSRGVVNLRGIIVPILDMRIKFNLGEARYDQFTVGDQS